MTTTDWFIDIALLLIVLRQMREERLTTRTILLPLGMIAWAASNYLSNIPTAGNDVPLAVIFAATGVLFGLAGGLLTRVRHADGHVLIKASGGAAALWIISMGFRLCFAVWSTHPSGAAHLTSFSAAHTITSGQAWVVALLLMAVGEVVVRLGTIIIRGQLLQARVDRTANKPAHRPRVYV
ncbi:hypothetical protein [Streptacidiphilus sp. P02-A3a]|uniref:hypothetical protein n=1 Tax=Streptacidiphilus sp. P02-A3a TaxID=2704468 RepID=UPI0015F9158F|nr:hypothetical protein [Streptacidiphilus sp. P02-A3a]QMU73109.1 hypothetical protein GXP74_37595 [Streptacidiphilus sp. P02-A3a]